MSEVNDCLGDYEKGDIIYLLLSKEQCSSVLDDWMECNYTCDLSVRRSTKTPGSYVVTIKSLMWATRIIKWHGYQNVTYKKPKKHG